ncbi:MAG TPA: hypothetical protein VEY12_05685, partial [Thermoplasmata archaeon]|nr:hypothetical protein [Thermoplasmata archaeon]
AESRALQAQVHDLRKEITEVRRDNLAKALGVARGEKFETRHPRTGQLVKASVKLPQRDEPPEDLHEANARWLESRRYRPWNELQKGY